MICPVCQTENRDDANFCFNCNHRLVVDCPRCSRRVTSQANFCDRCGLALDAPYRRDPAAANQAQQPQRQTRALAATPPPPAADELQPETPMQPAPFQALEEAVKDKALGSESSLAHFIPEELKHKLEAVRRSGEMVGERRIVTMLFCDVKGSTSAAEQLDPEEWSEIINGAFEHMIRPIFTYEGMVARLMGDSVLAFFGAPLAHEDDPQRAVLAGLDIVAGIEPYREEIKKTWGIDFNVRVGINTGLVVVGAVGSDLWMEYTALGDAINLAARMEQTAEPGTVRIAEDTYKMVKPLFEFEELGPIAVKGKEEPVAAYRVIGRLAAGGRVRGIEGLHAEMVGREAELASFKRVIEDLKQGVGRIVTVLGEAGLGKSRLVHEVKNYYFDLPGPQSDWFETTSLSYERNHAYGLMQRLVRQAYDIHYEDPPRIVLKKSSALIDALPEEKQPRARRLLEVMFGLAGNNGEAPLEGDHFKDELGEILQAWLYARFANRPAVMVFDDMHWSDGPSVDLIRRFLPLTADLPLVIVAVMREERRAPAWQIIDTADRDFRHRTTEISLRPLTESDSNELVSRLLAVADIPHSLRENILAKSDGNPFFIEEVVRALIDDGVVVPEERDVEGVPTRFWIVTSDGSNVSIPNNLQSLLSARMDRLEEATRATLQLASVIGRNFYLRVLQAVDENDPDLDKHVSALVRLEMIRESARVPEIEYSFRNPLTQEAVYKTILLKRRREFHHRVGEAMENLYASRLEGFYGLLAHHFTMARQEDKAIEYLRLAAGQAKAVYAYDEAAQNLQTALDLISETTPSVVQAALLEEMADVCRLVRDFAPAIAFYRRAIELWDKSGEGDLLTPVRLHRKIVNVATEAKWSVGAALYAEVSAASHESLLTLQNSLKELQEAGPHRQTVLLLIALSVDAWRIQEPPQWDTAQAYAQNAVDMSGELDDPVLLSKALGALANVLDGRSLLREHFDVAHRRLAITQGEAFNDAAEQIDAYRGAGVAHMYVGEYEQAVPHLAEAERRARKVRAIDQIANAVGIRAQCLFRADQWDAVLDTEQAWRELEQNYSREQTGETCFFVALSGSVYGLRGNYEKANAYAEESHNYMVSMSGDPVYWQRNQFY